VCVVNLSKVEQGEALRGPYKKDRVMGGTREWDRGFRGGRTTGGGGERSTLTHLQGGSQSKGTYLFDRVARRISNLIDADGNRRPTLNVSKEEGVRLRWWNRRHSTQPNPENTHTLKVGSFLVHGLPFLSTRFMTPAMKVQVVKDGRSEPPYA
jgi:hypothetical protein